MSLQAITRNITTISIINDNFSVASRRDATTLLTSRNRHLFSDLCDQALQYVSGA